MSGLPRQSQHLQGKDEPIAMSLRPTWTAQWVPSQPGLHKTCLKYKQKQNKPDAIAYLGVDLGASYCLLSHKA